MNPKDLLPGDNAKTGLVITAVVILLSGFLLFNAFQAKERERNLRIQKEQELSVKLGELLQVQTDLAELKKEKEESELRLQTSLSEVQTTLEETRKNESRAKTKIQELTKDKNQLSTLVEQNTAMIAKLNKKIQALERDKEDLRRGLERPDSSVSPAVTSSSGFESDGAPPAVRPLVTVNSQAPDVVDLGQIILRGEAREPAHVEHVNTMYGFIVVSAGSEDGLKMDTVVNVVRDNRFIAKAVVKKVRSSVATALLLPEWAREEVRLGDQISVNSLELPQAAPKRRLADFLPR